MVRIGNTYKRGNFEIGAWDHVQLRKSMLGFENL